MEAAIQLLFPLLFKLNNVKICSVITKELCFAEQLSSLLPSQPGCTSKKGLSKQLHSTPKNATSSNVSCKSQILAQVVVQHRVHASFPLAVHDRWVEESVVHLTRTFFEMLWEVLSCVSNCNCCAWTVSSYSVSLQHRGGITVGWWLQKFEFTMLEMHCNKLSTRDRYIYGKLALSEVSTKAAMLQVYK